MAKERRKYTQEYRDEAVRLSNQVGVTVVSVAKELGINAKMLYRWRAKAQQQQEAVIEAHGEIEELARMKAELEQVKLERDILKKPCAFSPRGIEATL